MGQGAVTKVLQLCPDLLHPMDRRFLYVVAEM